MVGGLSASLEESAPPSDYAGYPAMGTVYYLTGSEEAELEEIQYDTWAPQKATIKHFKEVSLCPQHTVHCLSLIHTVIHFFMLGSSCHVT